MSNLQPKGLTISIIFDAMSLNYGEGVGNISELKKLSRSGELYSYESRQAIRFDTYRLLKEIFGIDSDKEEPLTGDNDVVQFKPEANVKDYIEADLFGYMKTEKDKGALTRPAVVRINPAISLEPMNLDVEFGTNLNFAQRAGTNPNPFQFEHHSSLYSYTITIELDKVGKDENDEIDIEPEEKARRINMLLDVLKILNRNIKGRMESLNPLFAIGGVYNVKNPFFLGRLKVSYNKENRKYSVKTPIIASILDISFNGEKVKDNTHIGIIEGYWENESDIKELLPDNQVHNINDFFEELKKKVNDYYGIKN
ncbi:MAG TPA: type I-B CRISPR-associated protein Cas7/Cst2/DevR [Persephonella sp.]|uniref:Crispr-associated regulatory protein, devr family n=1 Tax=Persephonella marina (strain DSM 14350 / EX-H1) TaxID=123214 RepID=C0QR08_PERMH|nr:MULTISPECIES: type I-B CRISPR-associated protein Cas7/Cst2/DevR [Persephonella]ACO04120.1 crispr-associated regulatory protein, devr family [Persephonella marina EX-H1]HCB68853.1 type I-B CRISPR-associated protein Cas7/Cst2/DevR [Persephonella sp.]